MAATLTLYGRAACHLCARMRQALRPFEAQYGFSVQEVDIDGDPALRARYGELIPVLVEADEEICHYTLDPIALAAHFG